MSGHTAALPRSHEDLAYVVWGSNEAQTEYECAAKQIMQKHQGHKPKQLVERLFYPIVEGFKPNSGPEITFQVRELDRNTKELSELKDRTQIFENGDNVPSCSKCQQWLPEMYCQKRCP